jgi:hypothetical protein
MGVAVDVEGSPGNRSSLGKTTTVALEKRDRNVQILGDETDIRQ